MTDKEPLELAAKAAGIKLWTRPYDARLYIDSPMRVWNPLTDDGDALRLAVKLKIDINFDFDRIDVGCVDKDVHAVEYIYDKPTPTDTYAATRRAIVRAAAEIGKTL